MRIDRRRDVKKPPGRKYQEYALEYKIAVASDYAYVADNSRLVIVELAPVAWLDEISPDPALDTNSIHFEGHGTDDGTIERYVWPSSLDGELYNGSEATFNYLNLSLGEHEISLRVQDDHGVWSEGSSKKVMVKEKEDDNSLGRNILLVIIASIFVSLVVVIRLPAERFK